MERATEPFALSPAFKDFISGAVAGAFAITVSQPLDTVRVRLQQAAHSSGPTRNALGVLLSMVRREGVLSPFKGLTYPLLFASFQSAILFQAYGWTLRQLASADQPPPRQSAIPPQSLLLDGQPAQPQQAPGSASVASPPTSIHSANRDITTAAATSSSSSSSRAFPSAGAAGDPLPSATAPSTALHQLHLHHHHHQQDMQSAGVHGSHSVSGQVLAWVAARLGQAQASTATATATSQSVATASPSNMLLQSSQSCSRSSSSCRSGISSSSRGEERAGEESLGRSCAGTGVCGSSSSSSSRSCSIAAGGESGSGAELLLLQQTPLPTPWHGFLAGSVSGFAQVFLWSPVELLKLRAQLQTATPGSAGYRNPAAMAAQVLRQDGVAGLYRGFTLTVIRDVPSYAMYFWLYHDIAGALSPGIHPEQAPPSTQVLAGGMAGVIAWLPIYPLDVLKTRVQAVPASDSRGRTWAHFAREMYREAGARAFFRGVGPTLVRAFMMDGASFLGYTTTLKLLGGSGGGAAAPAAEGDGPTAPVPAAAAAAAHA